MAWEITVATGQWSLKKHKDSQRYREELRIVRKSSNPTLDYFKLLLFVVFLAELVLLLLAIIFGRVIGYDLTLKASFWLGIILAGCFAFVIFGNLLAIAAVKALKILRRRKSIR